MCAMKVPMTFTESPNPDGSANPIRNTKKIMNPMLSMSDLLQILKQKTGNKRGVYYGYMIFSQMVSHVMGQTEGQ